MDKRIKKLFTDLKIVSKIQNKLPKLFQLAELESSKQEKLVWKLAV